MQVIIVLLVLWYLCEKIDIIRHNRKVKRYKQYQAEQKQLAAQEKERQKAKALAIRQAEKQRKEEERIRKEEQRQFEKEQRLINKRCLASSETEYMHYRREQIYYLIECLEDEQEGTTAGSDEWIKYQKKIMAYEKQLQSMKAKEIKLNPYREVQYGLYKRQA